MLEHFSKHPRGWDMRVKECHIGMDEIDTSVGAKRVQWIAAIISGGRRLGDGGHSDTHANRYVVQEQHSGRGWMPCVLRYADTLPEEEGGNAVPFQRDRGGGGKGSECQSQDHISRPMYRRPSAGPPMLSSAHLRTMRKTGRASAAVGCWCSLSHLNICICIKAFVSDIS